jgi:hypothetical protein
MTNWCGKCEGVSYDGGPPMDKKLEECTNKYTYLTYRSKCNGAEDDCKAFVPQIKA